MEEQKQVDDSVIVEFCVGRKYLRTVETHRDKICAVFGLKSLRPLNAKSNDGSDQCENVSFQVISDSSLDGGEIAKRLQVSEWACVSCVQVNVCTACRQCGWFSCIVLRGSRFLECEHMFKCMECILPNLTNWCQHSPVW